LAGLDDGRIVVLNPPACQRRLEPAGRPSIEGDVDQIRREPLQSRKRLAWALDRESALCRSQALHVQAEGGDAHCSRCIRQVDQGSRAGQPAAANCYGCA
jgi:hypothetical protein